jgi:hypothetical protein
VAAELPKITGLWPRKFLENHDEPSVCEVMGPNFNFMEGDVLEIPDNREGGVGSSNHRDLSDSR